MIGGNWPTVILCLLAVWVVFWWADRRFRQLSAEFAKLAEQLDVNMDERIARMEAAAQARRERYEQFVASLEFDPDAVEEDDDFSPDNGHPTVGEAKPALPPASET